MYELLKYIKLYKMLNTTIFFLFTYRPDLSSKLWFFEIVCVEKMCIFWRNSCVYAKKCVSLHPILKNDITLVNNN